MAHSKSWNRLSKLSKQLTTIAIVSILTLSCQQEPGTSIEIPDPLEIKVIGKDYYWHFVYPGPDQVFDTDDDILVSKDIYVPAHSPVKLSITSEDYIYFFRVAEFELRESAIPDLTHEINFTPGEAGIVKLEVDPMCSAWTIRKDGSMGEMYILTKSDFKNWQKKQLSGK